MKGVEKVETITCPRWGGTGSYGVPSVWFDHAGTEHTTVPKCELCEGEGWIYGVNHNLMTQLTKKIDIWLERLEKLR